MADEHVHRIIQCRCGQKMKVPSNAAGKRYKCVRCGEPVHVAPEPAPRAEPHGLGQDAGPDVPPAPIVPPDRIGQLLIESDLITGEQLQEALALQQQKGGKTFELLIELGYLAKEALHTFLSKQPGIASIELDRVDISRKLLGLVPRELALESLILPIDQMGKLLTVAMACPLDVVSIHKVEQRTGLTVKAMLCRLDSIHAAVEKYYPAVTPEEGAPGLSAAAPETAATPEEDMSEALGALETLRIPEEIVTRVMALTTDAHGKIADVAAVAGTDPRLAAALLRTANSPAYGVAGHVDSLPMAVALLGKQGVSAVATQANKGESTVELDLSPLVGRARRCASVASALAVASGKVEAGSAYAAGLLHVLGCFALSALAPRRYQEIDLTLSATDLAEAEEKPIYGGTLTVALSREPSYWDDCRTVVGNTIVNDELLAGDWTKGWTWPIG